ncbi:hypothetical protein [Salinibius halmophilus]|nr:hypothetical protein [Salinibius halmophilus]
MMLSFFAIVLALSSIAIGIKLLSENRSTYSRSRRQRRRFFG